MQITLILVLLIAQPVLAGEHWVRTDVDGKIQSVGRRIINQQVANVFVQRSQSTYDLSNMRFRNHPKHDGVSEDDERKWAVAARREVLANIDSHPPDDQKFIPWAMNPKFSARQSDGVL
ncbi:hypothetical protein [Planctomycetes bacterium K23_9]|uniref:Uncharacterized protein n=1 Tax=Stieleria marina TaxID=1930275 RepID=A0A517NWD6_9BACT|nr:hypothetical protein K239x_34340 [Planctomycetes bacterium K23_9]